MYPQFPDVLRAVRQSMLRDLLPELGSDYAREQATGLLLLIEHLLDRWDRAFDALRDENADLRATLEAIAAAGEPAAASGCNAAQPARGEQLIAENRELGARLATVMREAPEGSAALRLALEFTTRQLAREQAAVAVGAITWE